MLFLALVLRTSELLFAAAGTIYSNQHPARKTQLKNYVPPTFKKSAFNCPHCNAYAKMHWASMGSRIGDMDLYAAKCSHCDKMACWEATTYDEEKTDFVDGRQVIPEISSTPMPHPEMPEAIKSDYQEARDILNRSPRGAAALLRLCIQKLCIELGETTGSIDKDVKSLVEKGLPVGIQKALDVVRVIGNHAVHPGKLTDEDISEVAVSLFELVNAVVDDRIARPKELEALYLRLPEGSRKAIADRDAKK